MSHSNDNYIAFELQAAQCAGHGLERNIERVNMPRHWFPGTEHHRQRAVCVHQFFAPVAESGGVENSKRMTDRISIRKIEELHVYH